MSPEAREFLARLKRIHDELAMAESDLRSQRVRIREAMTLLRLSERPAVVAAMLDRDEVWAVGGVAS